MLAEKADLQLQHDRVAELLEELEQELGPVDPQEMEEVRQEWPLPGEQNARAVAHAGLRYSY